VKPGWNAVQVTDPLERIFVEEHMNSAAGLRIIGDDVVPEDITRILGCEPTSTTVKGQVIRGKKTGQERIARTGSWHLNVPDRMPDDLDGQIMEILGKLNPDPDVWASLASRFRMDIFCGLFMANSSEGKRCSHSGPAR
jgi:hypothetical protein